MEELVAHGLRSLRECLPSEQALNTKVCLIIYLTVIYFYLVRQNEVSPLPAHLLFLLTSAFHSDGLCCTLDDAVFDKLLIITRENFYKEFKEEGIIIARVLRKETVCVHEVRNILDPIHLSNIK